MADKDRDSELKDVPLHRGSRNDWPEGVRPVALGELDLIGVDRAGGLYWNGKQVKVAKRISLSFWQTIAAIIISAGALGTIVQSFTSYNDWACKVGWPAIACEKRMPSK